jgi:antitoxin ParD1/3/4
MEKASITLTEAHHQLLHSVVESGEYATVSEAIRDALRGWELERKMQQAELEHLRREIQKGMDDIEAGRVVEWDPEAMKQRLRAKYSR